MGSDSTLTSNEQRKISKKGENQNQHLPLSRSLLQASWTNNYMFLCAENVGGIPDSDPQMAAGLQVEQYPVIMVGYHVSRTLPINRV